MNFESEITLLIKSRYPLVAVDTIDETYVSRQLFEVARSAGMKYYRWSLTKGLRVDLKDEPFYQTGDPVKMLKLAADLLDPANESVFVLKDFQKHLKDNVPLRLFKDLLNRARETRTTFFILGAELTLPPDIQPLAARIAGGYPDEKEILAEINAAVLEFRKSGAKIEIDLKPEEVKRVIKSLKGLSLQQVRSALNQAIVQDWRLCSRDLLEIEKFKKAIFDRDGVLEYFAPEGSAAIAGFDGLKRWVADRKAVIFNESSRLPPPKGLLMLGVQGCGKSLAAKVIAGELEVPLYRLDLNRLYSKYIGETEENLRKALKTVERLAPVCLWIDEIEKVFASSGGEIDGGVSRRILGTFLTWMQERKDRSFIAATANDIESLPPELLRKGRFDEIFFADLPSAASRAEIFRIHIVRRGMDAAAFDLEKLAEASHDFSGAEIEQAVISAMYRAEGAGGPVDTAGVLEQVKLARPISVMRPEAVGALRDWARKRDILPVG
ncbi:MAG: ATPase AAA [Elusimicrobia bacterium]|nr:MAG: ATPase AAA [Elusimicrobiota bacterium]KAF0155117.1 MAG: ATPase AAA [Elusimicrobiota bacterium]